MVVEAWQSALSRGDVVVALVRHGQTAWNVERRFLGATDVPLDAIGMAQAEALGRWVPRRFDRVYSSPLKRAFATAKHLDPEPVLARGLVEMGQGEVEGLLVEEARARFPGLFEQWLRDPVRLVIPGGESLTQCRDRAFLALADIVSGHRPGELVAAVTHQMVIAALSCTVAGEPLEGWRAFGVPNAAITLLSWDGTSFSLHVRGYRDDAVARAGSPD